MPRADKNALTKRLSRYARVSGAAASVGTRVAARRLLGKGAEDDSALGPLLRKALGGLKGPLMKVAQIVATLPDLVPPAIAAELATLQADAPPMGESFTRRRMAAELGPDWASRFRSFELKAAAAASLGQVHRAVGKDGRALACKLQYPDMAATVEADLAQLRLALALFGRVSGAVDTEAVQEEIAARLREELDYGREAKHLRLYAAMLKDVPEAHVPEAFPALSTSRLLTMDWLEGERLDAAAARRSQADRNALAIALFRAWYAPFYGYGVLHGDPHPGNYTVRPDGGLNLLDFGCVRIFPPGLVEAVITLYHALRTGDDARAVEAYKAWGFASVDKALLETLNIWARFIYAPLLEDKARPLEETNTGAKGKETAGRLLRELRKQGRVAIPRPFVFMDRASLGLGAVFLKLGATVNWHRLFHGMIEDFDAAALARRQTRALKAVGLEKVAGV